MHAVVLMNGLSTYAWRGRGAAPGVVGRSGGEAARGTTGGDGVSGLRPR